MSSRRRKSTTACMILAAGKGTRMNSAQNKVLHTLLGAPMVAYPVDSARGLGAAPIVAVLGHQKAEVAKALDDRFGSGCVTVVEQKVQKGTGHAVRLGLAPLSRFDGLVVILCGDAPLLRTETLAQLVLQARKSRGLAMLTSVVGDPTGYGRIVRDEAGKIRAVVEHKDATSVQHRIAEVNAGIYAAPAEFLRKATAKLSARNAQGEYYLTDIVAQAAATIGVVSVDVSAEEMSGVNDRAQLVAAEKILAGRIVREHMKHATFRAPDQVVVEPLVTIAPDAEIGRNVVLRGRTQIGAFARIDDGCILTDTVVGKGAHVLPYCVSSQAVIGENNKIGPFAHLRPGTLLAADVHVGNFVETKKTQLGRGSKANHLTYLGDTIVGEKVNVGAGTITCNYNGFEKRQTIIEDGAFIGSDTQLVAPVRVGKRAVVAAGATITEDVRDGALAISRAPCKQVDGYADRLAERYAGQKKKTAR
ncbi:MAG TPA: bifunctional UDP-N-acetylglucosamine diphosphorylase/glucosamine-1-phosphate N-acetyltransferase GlmU [Polyangia bacterium]